MSAASSGVALGRMPGSVKLVLSREMTTNTKSTPPITGMKTVRCSTRNGQLWKEKTVNPEVHRHETPLKIQKINKMKQQGSSMMHSRTTGNKHTKNDISSYSLECKEKATRDNNKAQCQRKDTALSGQDDSSIAEKPVLPGEHFPFPPRPLRTLPGVVLCGRGWHRQRPWVDLLVLAVLHHVNSADTLRRWLKAHTKLSFLAAFFERQSSQESVIAHWFSARSVGVQLPILEANAS